MVLTDTFVKKVKHKGAATGEKYSHGKGLYLHVTASGKYWRMAYRMHGKQRTLALGVYPAVTLAKAARDCNDARELLAQGIDPSDQKRADKLKKAVAAANSLESVALEYLDLKQSEWSASHYEREYRNIHKDLLPWLGKRAIASITGPELLEVLRRIERRGAVESAKRVRVTAGGVWGLAIASGRAERNITLDIAPALKKSEKKNHAALVDPQKVGQLLRVIHAYTGTPAVCAAFKLAPILFQRPGNLRGMRWCDLDLSAGLWTIPSADMKRSKAGKATGQPHVVPLPSQAVAILESIHPLTGQREYVFPGATNPKQPMSEAALGAALIRLGYQGVQTWHGFRATGRTLIREALGFDPDVIEAALAHTGQISHGGAYDRAAFISKRVTMAQEWADYLDNLRLTETPAP
ncbi:integrase arm-type DNA-binding domain-containing protein [Rhodoferax sp.]|uniref:tyrosine-type recombinase/integrase n=1 Tax=Rhodoferax sp. TaxID=50421 RepID=UPI0025FF9A27|nr:integrase arm-type DNA-binding domain-containing protein [Rhodoferax sp.]